MYKGFELENGIRVVTENIPHFRSVSIGLWFKVGSINEADGQEGLSHFIEHMLFKGTKKRSSKEIAQTMDAVGGQLNAFTAKECTCLYSKVMDEHLELGLDLLSDMVLNSIFDSTEMEKEKGVILEEISMYKDSPEDVVHELLSSEFFRSHPLGKPILGTITSVTSFTKDQIKEYYDYFYGPGNLVISIAGNFQEDKLRLLLDKYFGGWGKTAHIFNELDIYTAGEGAFYRHKDIEQAHLCIGCPGIPLGDEDIYALMILNNIFGGGMSSRLFQSIREEKGLAYSVFSYPSSYVHGGLFTVYAGIKPSQVAQVVSLIHEEVQGMKNKNISQEEFNMAREQLKGNYILGLENTSSRMTALGRNQLLVGKITSPDEVLDKINKAKMEDLYRVLDNMFLKDHTTMALVSRNDLRQEIQGIF
ncbi:MAG TPA: pitrilysin family protein [Clostridia bacterium]|nr:pitrilysin family protein [Clostridia bacterium]